MCQSDWHILWNQKIYFLNECAEYIVIREETKIRKLEDILSEIYIKAKSGFSG
jgi:hypothetical protein